MMQFVRNAISDAKDFIEVNTKALLNTIIEGVMIFLIGGAMYIFSYLMTGEVMIVASNVTGMPASVTTGMAQG